MPNPLAKELLGTESVLESQLLVTRKQLDRMIDAAVRRTLQRLLESKNPSGPTKP